VQLERFLVGDRDMAVFARSRIGLIHRSPPSAFPLGGPACPVHAVCPALGGQRA
jgi:hypothetical protein